MPRNSGSYSERKTIRMDKSHIDMLYHVSQIRNITESDYVRHSLDISFGKDNMLTEIEKKYFQQQSIIRTLDSMERILEYTCTGNIEIRIEHLIYHVWGNKLVHGERPNTKALEISIFELLDKVKDYDDAIFAETIEKLKILNIRDDPQALIHTIQ